MGPERHLDILRQNHILKVLNLLKNNAQIARQFKNISRPFAHKVADQLIRDTLALPPNTSITDAHAKRAVLASWLCTLRQNVGSCFATAPAIIVHTEQPSLFLKDVNELLSTGSLKRTFGGIQYAVPLSSSWGAGDLRRPIIITQNNTAAINDLSLSPGLIQALESVNILQSKTPLANKIKQLRELLHGILEARVQKQMYTATNSEEIIDTIILNHLKITRKDLEDYLNRPRDMIHESLLMQTPQHLKTPGTKGETCAAFFTMQDIAYNAFKALADNALLKSWEFTLASFSETKSEFTRWNLYSSLGLEPEQVGGIGYTLYTIIKEKLDACNQKIHDLQDEYEQAYGQVKFAEGRLKNASTEKEVQWLRVEYQSKMHEFYLLEEMRNEQNAKAQRLANLFKDLIENFDKLFPEFFQEVYDADMHEVATGPYDDSPAGFRLLYKHGRANTSQWTRIKSPQDFVEALSSFFVAIEPQLIHLPEMEGLEREISECITAVVQHVKTKEFLETAFHRMAAAHKTPILKDPLDHLDQIDKKPWAYTSGGTMNTLISCYFKIDKKPTQVSRWVENPTELCVFLLDTLKQIPYKVLEEYAQDPLKSMLMTSPTHAFILKPGLQEIREGWQTDVFTYTWVRDRLIIPQERFWDAITLDIEILQYLSEQLVQKVPPNFQPQFKMVFGSWRHEMKVKEFRNHVVETMEHDRGLNFNGRTVVNPDDIDALLYTSLPMIPFTEIKNLVLELLHSLPGISVEEFSKIETILESIGTNYASYRIITSKQLREICLGLICLAKETTSAALNYPQLIFQAAQKMGYAPPTPIFFADTNWVKDWFGFVVNPGSDKFELWRFDPFGFAGYPMSVWEEWLNGSRKDIPWSVLNKPQEYKGNGER